MRSKKDKRGNANHYNRFISYFQKVVTVGVVTCNSKLEEAMEEAKIIFKSNEPEKCFFDETDWELTDTVVYDPEIEVECLPSEDNKSIDLIVGFNKDILGKIASAFEKDVDELTKDDITKFVNKALEYKINEGRK